MRQYTSDQLKQHANSILVIAKGTSKEMFSEMIEIIQSLIAGTLIANGRPFTALFAAADVMAIGAIRALHNNGLRVPRDVSVMGFDGLPLGSFLVPQLSTVIQSAQTMAQRSVEILIDRIEHGGDAVHEAILCRNAKVLVASMSKE